LAWTVLKQQFAQTIDYDRAVLIQGHLAPSIGGPEKGRRRKELLSHFDRRSDTRNPLRLSSQIRYLDRLVLCNLATASLVVPLFSTEDANSL
jgi:hypothetical protein